MPPKQLHTSRLLDATKCLLKSKLGGKEEKEEERREEERRGEKRRIDKEKRGEKTWRGEERSRLSM